MTCSTSYAQAYSDKRNQPRAHPNWLRDYREIQWSFRNTNTTRKMSNFSRNDVGIFGALTSPLHLQLVSMLALLCNSKTVLRPFEFRECQHDSESWDGFKLHQSIWNTGNHPNHVKIHPTNGAVLTLKTVFKRHFRTQSKPSCRMHKSEINVSMAKPTHPNTGFHQQISTRRPIPSQNDTFGAIRHTYPPWFLVGNLWDTRSHAKKVWF